MLNKQIQKILICPALKKVLFDWLLSLFSSLAPEEDSKYVLTGLYLKEWKDWKTEWVNAETGIGLIYLMLIDVNCLRQSHHCVLYICVYEDTECVCTSMSSSARNITGRCV